MKIKSGSRKKKSAFEALILLIGFDKYKSHVFNPAAKSLAFHLWKGYQARERHCPWLGHLCFRVVHQLKSNWAVEGYIKLEQVGVVGAGLVYLCGSQKGHF